MNTIKYDNIILKAEKHKLNPDGKIYAIANQNEYVCNQEVYIQEIYKNIESQDEYVKIAFRNIGKKKWETVVVDKLNILSNGKIVVLCRKGLDVSTTNATKMVAYFKDILNSNEDVIPLKRSTSKMGWRGEDFIPYDKEITYDGEDNFRETFESITTAGEYTKWLKEMSYVRQNLIARLAMAGSFGSVLLRKIGKKPLVVMLWGTSGDGKTVACMCAMSIWGCPEEGKLQYNMNSTDNFYFRMADFMNNLPCFFDELQAYKGNIDKLIMSITEGIDRGKAKADGGIEAPKRWQNIFLLTGEDSASKYNSGGGTMNRLIEISSTEKIIKYGSQTARVVKKNYGYAGIDFINYIKTIDEETLYERYEKRLDEILKYSDTEEKQAQNMAVLLLADDLARECIFKEEEPIDVKDVLKYLFTKQEIDISERAWEFIQNEFAMNIYNFEESARERWGKIIENGFCVMINKNILQKLLLENSFNPKKIFKDWAYKGYLIKKDGRISQNRSVDGVKGHYIELRMKLKEGGN